ncbi:MAG: glycoside hydrolase family 15 protein [Deltaproteobacteria bacterium]|nr:glycoside hydrolase family 15 protein [Deltaproteobacteria bacterium]
MDLYTAAERISRTFLIGDEPPAIGMHGIIGDGETCGLIGVDGAVDWLCMPRFDSPSVFASLLDQDSGGTFRISPVQRPFESLQAYDTDTNVLQTLFRVPGQGAITLTDFMPWSNDQRSSVHEIHRLISCQEGEVEVEILFDPRFDYGKDKPKIRLCPEGAIAYGSQGEHLCLATEKKCPLEIKPDGGAAARFRLSQGQHVWAILSWDAPFPEPITAYRPFEHMRATRRFWRSWAALLKFDGPWRHEVLRSALTLKLLQYRPTGAMVASPTTSLPVCLSGHGSRNWDYRFSWTRDASMAVRANNLIGYRREAHRFFHFMRDTINQRGQLDLMVTVDGQNIPDEIEMNHLSGHGGAKPVRIGNAASNQLQLDIDGAVLDAALMYEQSGGIITLRLWRHLRNLVEHAIKHRNDPDHGIWEPRSKPAHNVHSKLMAWVAIDRGLQISPVFGAPSTFASWAQAREELREEILQRGYNQEQGTFVGQYEGSDVDATLMLFPHYGFLPASDPRVQRTLERIQDELQEGRFLHRYHTDDGVDGKEGAFALCGFWLAEALALSGKVDRAIDVFQIHLGAANHLGLMAEEVNPATGAPLGNFPQAFSHLGLIQAAACIDRALHLRAEETDSCETEPE